MINLPVSEAYAFDYLAILTVKAMVPLPGAADEASKCRDYIADQIGDRLTWKVLGSPENLALQQANRDVWDFVAKAARDECKASDVDAANQRRHAAKKALQERFWPHEPLTEVKSKRPYESVT
jgi:hypothetical protein